MKRIGVLAMAFTQFVGVQAAQLTPDQALQRIAAHTVGKGMPSNASYRLSYTEKSMGEAMLYVFNRGEKGFIVTSADDRLPALLGYSDEGAFDVTKVSPELKWWLGQYASEASYFLKNEDKYIRSARTRVDRPDIPELLNTKWDQWAPYNQNCPDDGGGQCVTGCVATAMAQVIKYHNYPATGSGSHSYNWYGKTLSFDYEAVDFDYANMLDEYNPYDDTATDVQKEAVAQLMYACGVGVNMSYSSSMSSAFDLLVVNALQKYFNYSSSVHYLLRSHYTTQEWEDIVYAELEAKRPVIYGGQAPTGGHEFVCDGYKDGFFHINWGWSGYGNGYFPLSGLDPNYEGIGGFEGGYNYDQDIICGITPDKGETSSSYAIYSSGGLGVAEVQFNRYAVMQIDNGFIGNYGVDPVTLDFYLKVVSDDGQEYVSESALSLSFSTAAADGYVSGYSGFTLLLPEDLSEGNYKAYLGFKTPEGSWHDVSFPIITNDYLNMNVDKKGNVTFTSGEPKEKAHIQVISFAPATTVISGEKTVFNFSAKNIGDVEYAGPIYIRVYSQGSTEPLVNTGISFSLISGVEFNEELELTYQLEDGKYDVIFFDMYGEKISDTFPLYIGLPPVFATGISLSQTEARMTVDDTLQLSAIIEPENANDKTVIWSTSNAEVANVDENGLVTAFNVGNATITATSVVSDEISAACEIVVEKTTGIIYATSITLDKVEIEAVVGETLKLTATVLPEDTTDKAVKWSSSNEAVATVDSEGNVTILSIGSAIITAATTDGSELEAICTISAISGIEEIVCEAGVVDIYTMNGVLIKRNADVIFFSQLPKGTYIIYAKSKAYKIVI